MSRLRAVANHAGPPKQRLLANPRSPRLRNPDQLRRGERYGPRHSYGEGSILDAESLEWAPWAGQ